MEEEQGGAGRERLSDDASNERYASAPHPRHTLLLLPERTTHQRTQSPQQHVQLLLAQSYLSRRPTAPSCSSHCTKYATITPSPPAGAKWWKKSAVTSSRHTSVLRTSVLTSVLAA